MSTFILACLGLLLLSGLFFLWPWRRQGSEMEDVEATNLAWFRQRQLELAEADDPELERDAQLRLLEDSQQSASPQQVPTGQVFRSWLLLPVVAVMAVGLYYALGAAPDVQISKRLQTMSDETSPEVMAALVQDIERRSAQRPDNLHYLALLGRFYMGQEDYIRARETYRQLAKESPEDAFALAYAAQADFLAAGRVLSDEARMQAEQSLAVDPHQRTALGLLGMASFEQGSYRAAIEYWERLLAMETPGSESAQMIDSVIAMARERVGEAPVAAPQDAPVAAGVTVAVRFPEGASYAATDTVFVLARNAGSDSRMPIAVQRLQAAQLPITLRLDDNSSMAGQKLSEADSVLIVVQVSPGGTPGEAGATYLGQAGPLQPSTLNDPVEVILEPRKI